MSGVYACDCGELFDRAVFHCPICNHHWLDNRLCRNCYKANPQKRGHRLSAPKGKKPKKLKRLRRHWASA